MNAEVVFLWFIMNEEVTILKKPIFTAKPEISH